MSVPGRRHTIAGRCVEQRGLRRGRVHHGRDSSRPLQTPQNSAARHSLLPTYPTLPLDLRAPPRPHHPPRRLPTHPIISPLHHHIITILSIIIHSFSFQTTPTPTKRFLPLQSTNHRCSQYKLKLICKSQQN